MSFSLVLPLIGMALAYFYSIKTFQYWLGIALVASMGMAAIYASRVRHLGYFEDIVLVLAFLLSLIGIGLTDFSAASRFRFWSCCSSLVWPLSLIGIMIGVTSIAAAFVERFIWPIILIAILVATIAVFWEKISSRGA